MSQVPASLMILALAIAAFVAGQFAGLFFELGPGAFDVPVGIEPVEDSTMMMTEMKWPGWPELPFLLLFVGVVLLVGSVLLEASGSRADGESHGEPSSTPANGRDVR